VEIYNLEGDQLISQGMEFALQGQYSLDMPQKSFKVKAKAKYGDKYFEASLFEDRPFTEYKCFVLRDSGNDCSWTRMNDGFQGRLIDAFNEYTDTPSTVIHQAWQPVVVYLNGQYWGHYNLRERADRYFIAQHEGLSLSEADQMIAACREAGVLLMYAEELCFAPKYVRAKKLVDEGALGRVFLVKQSEEHFGPHSDWFWDVNKSGGGVLLDMGCHSIEYARWVFGKPAVKNVYANMGVRVHTDRTRGEDHSLCIVEFEGKRVALAENSWAKQGGVDDQCEIYGSGGFTRADLLRGSSLLTYSEPGYGYAVEKAASTRGYTFTMYEEIWNYGFPQEMAHFVRCVQGREQPIETGEDGREVLKIMLAAYESAGAGHRIDWPYEPRKVDKPIDLWLGK
jgi:predicted dehydrogenase